MASETRLFVGTRKAAFIFRSTDGRKTWTASEPILPGASVYHFIEDPRDPDRMYAAANYSWWGPLLARSVDGGRTWTDRNQTPRFAPEDGMTVNALWHIRPGHADRPGEVWMGVDPATLFRSRDWGETWEQVRGLNEHPTREAWQPGGGGLCLHGIRLDPTNPDSMIVTISAGGAFRTDDGGASWRPINQGVRADFLPDPTMPVGHCVHHLLPSPVDPTWLFQQNHCGVYRSADGGDSWQEVTAGLPSEFGFAAAVHPHEPRTVYVAPLEADLFRTFPGGAMAVWRSRDGGDSWEALREGLPQKGAYLSAYREGMTTDRHADAGVYIGTSNGQIFFSPDSGDHWQLLADHLPPVLSLEASST